MGVVLFLFYFDKKFSCFFKLLLQTQPANVSYYLPNISFMFHVKKRVRYFTVVLYLLVYLLSPEKIEPAKNYFHCNHSCFLQSFIAFARC